MQTFEPRTVYASDAVAFYESTTVDHHGKEFSFYHAIVSTRRYLLSKEEGVALEKQLKKSYTALGDDGVESILIEFSSSRIQELFH